MPPFEFRRRLEGEVVVKELHLPDGSDMTGSLPPVGGPRNKVVRGGQLDIEIEAVLKNSDGFKCSRGLGVQLVVDINRLLAETQEPCPPAPPEGHLFPTALPPSP